MTKREFPYLLSFPCPLGQTIGAGPSSAGNGGRARTAADEDWDSGRTLGALVRVIRAVGVTLGTITIQRSRIVVTADREPTPAELDTLVVENENYVSVRRPSVVPRDTVAPVPTDAELA